MKTQNGNYQPHDTFSLQLAELTKRLDAASDAYYEQEQLVKEGLAKPETLADIAQEMLRCENALAFAQQASQA